MATNPQRLREALTGVSPKTLKDLSRELSLSEKELPDLLEKLERSLAHGAAKLQVQAASCVACRFEFVGRGRASKPSRCPSCRSERIVPARYWIQAE